MVFYRNDDVSWNDFGYNRLWHSLGSKVRAASINVRFSSSQHRFDCGERFATEVNVTAVKKILQVVKTVSGKLILSLQFLVPLDLSKDTKPYIKLRSSKSVHWDQQVEVIKNGNKVLKRTVGETKQEYEPTTAEEKQDKRNAMNARGTMLMALPNKDQLKFHSYKDAKLIMEAIEKRYGGNKESKKVQRTLLKQQYENFVGLSSETMGQTFDSTNNNSNTNKADNTTYGVSAANTQSILTSGDNLKQINPDDLKEMDLQWEMAMLTIRVRRFIKRTGKKLDVNGQRVRFDRTKVECYNCHKYGHFARECKAPRNQENRGRWINRRTVTIETPTENALVAQDGIRGYDWSYQGKKEHPTKFALMAHTSSGSSSSSDSEVIDKFKMEQDIMAALLLNPSPAVKSFVNLFEMLENQEYNKSKSDKGYHAVPLPLQGISYFANMI
ncbi:ribonuclease H-like domain-containing protein [Tanacetum coccineum]